MKALSKFVTHIFINVLALIAIIYLVPNVYFSGSWIKILIIAFVLGIINFLIKPVLKLLLGPLIVLTLGLFSLIINAAILWAITWFFPELVIPLGMPLVWSTIVVSVVNFFTHSWLKSSDK
jgi:putative membrane protein